MRLPIALYVIALAGRAIPAWLHPDPAYPDSTYYVGVARSLAAGRGFTLDFIWNFVDVGGRLPADPTLPIPSNAHWMPLASLIQVPFMVVLGAAPLVVLIPFLFIGATVAPLTWAIARDAGLSASQATAAGLMSAVPGAVLPFLGQPDNFALFMPLGALALWLCAKGLRGDRRAFVLGGVVVGVATLARNDGVLLGVPFALGWLGQRWRAWSAGGHARVDGVAPLPFMAAVGCLVGFLVVMGPWYARQLAVFGALSPSASSGRILWIKTYGELFSVTGDPSIGTFLSQGLVPLIQSRLDGFYWAFAILAALPFLFFLVPFVLWSAWQRRRDGLFGPWIAYTVTLLLFSGLLFAVHVRYGTFLHSAVAVVPHAYVLAVEGIGLAVAWVARWRRHWNVPLATRNFTAVAVVVLSLGAAYATSRTVDGWGAEARVRQGASAALAKVAQPGDRVMSADPGAYSYYAGLGGVITPADPIGVVEQVVRAYDIRWLVLERAHIVDAFAPIYLGTPPVPDWLVSVTDAGDGTIPTWRLFAVCLSAQDPKPACRSASAEAAP